VVEPIEELLILVRNGELSNSGVKLRAKASLGVPPHHIVCLLYMVCESIKPVSIEEVPVVL
jgi:hypothetical protein